MSMTNTLENRFIDWYFRGQAFNMAGSSAAAGSGPSTLYIALFTSDPGETGAGTEVSGAGYSRVPVTSTMANWSGTQGNLTTTQSTGTTGTTRNNNPIIFGIPEANWGTITHFGIYDSQTGGTLQYYGALSSAKTVNQGDPSPAFASSTLSITLN